MLGSLTHYLAGILFFGPKCGKSSYIPNIQINATVIIKFKTHIYTKHKYINLHYTSIIITNIDVMGLIILKILILSNSVDFVLFRTSLTNYALKCRVDNVEQSYNFFNTAEAVHSSHATNLKSYKSKANLVRDSGVENPCVQ